MFSSSICRPHTHWGEALKVLKTFRVYEVVEKVAETRRTVIPAKAGIHSTRGFMRSLKKWQKPAAPSFPRKRESTPLGFMRSLKKWQKPAAPSFPHGSTPVEWMAGIHSLLTGRQVCRGSPVIARSREAATKQSPICRVGLIRSLRSLAMTRQRSVRIFR